MVIHYQLPDLSLCDYGDSTIARMDALILLLLFEIVQFRVPTDEELMIA